MSESKKYLCEEADNVTRFEVIGLSIMAYLDTHVKHDNSSVCRGVSLKDAREWIREQIKRNTTSEDLVEKAAEDYTNNESSRSIGKAWLQRDVRLAFIAGAQWKKEQIEKQAEKALSKDGITIADLVAYDKGVAEGRRMEKEETNEKIQDAINYAKKCFHQSREDMDNEKAYYWDGGRDCLTALQRDIK